MEDQPNSQEGSSAVNREAQKIILTDELAVSVWDMFSQLSTKERAVNLLSSRLREKGNAFEEWDAFVNKLDDDVKTTLLEFIDKTIRFNNVREIATFAKPDFNPRFQLEPHRRITPEEIAESRFFRIGFQGAAPAEL